jgi:hypothetical protein
MILRAERCFRSGRFAATVRPCRDGDASVPEAVIEMISAAAGVKRIRNGQGHG